MYRYLPFEYTFRTRIKTKAERISWLIIFPLFLAFLSLLEIESGHWIKVLFAFLIIMSSYEIGYIYNDNITVLKEKSPTERTKTFCNNFTYQKGIASCFVWFIVLISTYYLLYDDFFTYYLISVFFVIQIVFFAHNRIRNRFNIITYLLLVSCRYLLPIFLFVEPTIAVLVFFTFPVCRTIEHACKLKYGLYYLYEYITNFDLYRVLYYSLMSTFVFMITEIDIFYLTLYFFIYRFLTYIFSRQAFAKRNKHGSYR